MSTFTTTRPKLGPGIRTPEIRVERASKTGGGTLPEGVLDDRVVKPEVYSTVPRLDGVDVGPGRLDTGVLPRTRDPIHRSIKRTRISTNYVHSSLDSTYPSGKTRGPG